MTKEIETTEIEAGTTSTVEEAPITSAEVPPAEGTAPADTSLTCSTTEPQTLPRQSRSVILKSYGGCSKVKVETRPSPTPAPGEVLIKVKACGMGFNDILIRQRHLDIGKRTPFIMGSECAGEIIALGEGATKYAIGDRVLGMPESGGWAEIVAVKEKFAFPIPNGMTCYEAAAVFVNYVSAYIMAFDLANLRSKQSVLIHTAAGGMGTALAQLCQTLEDVKVFGTTSGDKLDILKPLYNQTFSKSMSVDEIKRVAPQGIDIVFESRGLSYCNVLPKILKASGKCIVYGGSSILTGDTKEWCSDKLDTQSDVKNLTTEKAYKGNTMIGSFSLRDFLYKQEGHERVGEVYEILLKLFEDGMIRPVFDTCWAFEDVPKAMKRMQNRLNVGKIILDSGMIPKPTPQVEDPIPFKCCPPKSRALQFISARLAAAAASSQPEGATSEETQTDESQPTTSGDTQQKSELSQSGRLEVSVHVEPVSVTEGSLSDSEPILKKDKRKSSTKLPAKHSLISSEKSEAVSDTAAVESETAEKQIETAAEVVGSAEGSSDEAKQQADAAAEGAADAAAQTSQPEQQTADAAAPASQPEQQTADAAAAQPEQPSEQQAAESAEPSQEKSEDHKEEEQEENTEIIDSEQDVSDDYASAGGASGKSDHTLEDQSEGPDAPMSPDRTQANQAQPLTPERPEDAEKEGDQSLQHSPMQG